MEKHKQFHGFTPDWLFELDVFEEENADKYVGILNGHTPSLLQPVVDDLQESEIETMPEERFTETVLEKLLEASKKRMEEIGGELIRFFEVQDQE